MTSRTATRPRVLQRIEQFVGRTTNWMYDHLRAVPRHEPIVFCDALANRIEFPDLDAREREHQALGHRLWRRVMGDRPHPADARWLRRAEPIALHSHFGYVATEDFGLREMLGVPWVVSFYGADVYELGQVRDWRDRYERLFQRIDLALALGPQMAVGLEQLGCPADRILVHPLGVDIGAIPHGPRVRETESTLRVLFAGTFREKKGVEYLIRGVAAARARGVRIHVTLVGDAAGKPGDRETKAAIEREISRLGMEDLVTTHRFMLFDELMKLALSSHVFVAPSVTSASGDAEGTPFVLQQMMASGMPIIATQHSDIPFLLGPHRHLLVPERDPVAIADRLHEYWESPERMTRDGILMRDRMLSALDVRDRATALSDIYDGMSTSGASMSARVPAAFADRAHPVS